VAASELAIAPFLNKVNEFILNPIIALLFAIAFLVFVFGIFQFISKTGEASAREKGKNNILWGLVGMFIMFGAYGIIHIILGTFGIQNPASSYIQF
jgi:hypothetical protein